MEAKNLTKKELEVIKNALLVRKKELEDELATLYKNDPGIQVQDIGDQAQSLSMETLRLSLQDADVEEYNRIIKALEMIEEGAYGICVDCNQPISDKRLKVYPNSTRCLICQETFEEKLGK